MSLIDPVRSAKEHLAIEKPLLASSGRLDGGERVHPGQAVLNSNHQSNSTIMELTEQEKTIVADLITFAWQNGGIRHPQIAKALEAIQAKLGIEKK
jgi:hypothetical protein